MFLSGSNGRAAGADIHAAQSESVMRQTQIREDTRLLGKMFETVYSSSLTYKGDFDCNLCISGNHVVVKLS